MAESLGLVAGAGTLPALMAHEARQAGWRVVAFALADPAGLAGLVDRIVPCRVGEVGPIFDALAGEGIRHVVLAGRVWKDGLFLGTVLDETARRLVGQSPDWTDDGLLGTATAALASMGIELLDQRRFLGVWLAPVGHVAGPVPGATVERDVACGLRLAREVARHGIGQTVVVRAGTVVAVEAMEGTDEAIRRGLGLGGAGSVVVKAVAPAHDYRFDVPTVGATTMALCAAGQASALAIEAGRVLLLERDAVAAEAARAGVSVVGVAGDSGAA